jgi:hypothetical protein
MVKWNMSGDWELLQSNGLVVKMTLVHHLDGTVEGCGECISATAPSDTDVPSAVERVNPDLFSIIGRVTHDEVYLKELRTALRQTYRAKINEGGRVVGGVATDAFNRAYSFTANGKAHLRLSTVHALPIETPTATETPNSHIDVSDESAP